MKCKIDNRIFVIILIIHLMSIYATAQPVKAETRDTLVIKNSILKDTIINLTSYTSIYNDTLENNSDFLSIKSKRFSSFQTIKLDTKTNMSYKRRWLKFTVINRSGIDSVPVIFSCGKHALIKMYNSADGYNSGIQAGFLAFNNQQNTINASYEIQTKLPLNKMQTYYIQVTDVGKLTEPVNPNFFFGKTYYKYALTNDNNKKPALVINLILIGGILVLGLFVLAQFFSNRDQSYLYYSLYTITICTFLERSFEYNFDTRFISLLFPMYFFKLSALQGIAGGIFYTLFLQNFLDFRLNYIKLYNYCRFSLLLLITGFLLLSVFVLLEIQGQIAEFLNLAMILFPPLGVLLIMILVTIIIKKNPLTKYVITGFSFLLTGVLIDIYLNNFSHNFISPFFPPATYMEIGILLEVFFFALGLGHKKRLIEMEKRQAEYKSLELEVFSLRAQMNPHFIFNCLNSIKLYTLQNDTASATEYLTKFSKLIRLVMENSAKGKIILTSELDMLRLYIELEAMRFKEKLEYHFTIEKNVEVDYIEMPPLLLQPYVENAIWHGLMPKEEGGKIDINVAMNTDKSLLEISIIDNGIGRIKSAALNSKYVNKHESYGMKVTSDRIALINQVYKTGAAVKIDDLFDENNKPSGTKVIIQIPV